MITIRKITATEDLKKAFTIRDEVFVKEQGCPADLEHEHDDTATHFLAMSDDTPAGAARWRRTADGYKLERFAVLPQYRGKGIATAMIKAVLADLPADAAYIYLNAQVDAVPLYEQNGFIKEGGQFEEAGIRHYKMIRK